MAFSPAQICDWTLQLERFLLKRLGSRVLARDLAHETVLRLLEAERCGEAPDEPRAWLFRIARNLAVDEVRKNLPSPIGLEAQVRLLDPGPPGPPPVFQVARWELSLPEMNSHLDAAIESLPAHYRRVLEAHYYEGLACEDMAVREQVSVANVKVRLFRARRRLQRLLVNAVRQEKTARA